MKELKRLKHLHSYLLFKVNVSDQICVRSDLHDDAYGELITPD